MADEKNDGPLYIATSCNLVSVVEVVDVAPSHAVQACDPGHRDPQGLETSDLPEAFVVKESLRRPSVPGLLALRRPSNVARLIAAIIVDAVDRVLHGRARAHVFDKGLEGVAPSRADYDSTTAVSKEPRRFGVLAPGDHLSPDVVAGVLRHPVRSASGDGRVARETPTRLRRSASQSCRADFFADLPAVADALPPGPLWPSARVRNTLLDSEPSETLTSQLRAFAHLINTWARRVRFARRICHV